ncbi:MAG: hypothetical protein CVV64_10080 [Candidatus Wallbacteria bacterium HGW-Wallbacteria-1]|jgi:Pyruvate/2-oxoacid:ferredoxin oxidoreductase gamma subunit|uniref:Uncharacterized protein n=1 Tax=Candidatus Wallbacteria bacterium HGW-Wallbacteria-1 TaxID=2013854 RepID=A0A2N1PPN5_9BACT|nr:MAG: hypothetical protein CVV64_10080 [Candidatus Wallbacteria bacterium HGW-Wallbacteria-1]
MNIPEKLNVRKSLISCDDIGIILTGIGGQGVNFISTLLRQAIGIRHGFFTGYDNRGGAQRYGHVCSVIRFRPSKDILIENSESPPSGADDSKSPLAMDLPNQRADCIIALEASEGLRFLNKFHESTIVVADQCIVVPTNVRRDEAEYYGIENIAEQYREISENVFIRDFRSMARKFTGKAIDANLLALGFALRKLNGLLIPDDFSEISHSSVLETIRFGYEIP